MDRQSTSDNSNRHVSTGGPSSDDAPATSETEQEQETLKEQFLKSAKGQGDPIDKKNPDVPFVVVALTYLIVLAVVLLVVALIIFLW